MTVYRQKDTEGTVTTWYAARRMVLENPTAGPPVAFIEEVERTAVEGRVINERLTGRHLSVAVQQPGVLIPHINPETFEQILDEDGQPIPAQSFMDESFAYLCACVYIYAARQADAQQEET